MSTAAAEAAQVTDTQDEILEEFTRVMHEWAHRPFTHPCSAGICGAVELPGLAEMAVRAAEFEVRAALARSGRRSAV